MELENLKNTWDQVNDQVKKHSLLSPEIIDEMTKKKHYSRVKNVAYPEMIGAVICLAGAVFIGLNFTTLDTAVLQGVAVLSIVILLSLPVLSFISLPKFKTSDVNKSYSETLKTFALQKLRFHKFQKINVTLSYVLLVTIIILLPKFFGGKDITGSKSFWIFSFSFGYIFLSFYSRWVSKYYNKTLRQAEELLKELV